jgi:hypothetical protein
MQAERGIQFCSYGRLAIQNNWPLSNAKSTKEKSKSLSIPLVSHRFTKYIILQNSHYPKFYFCTLIRNGWLSRDKQSRWTTGILCPLLQIMDNMPYNIRFEEKESIQPLRQTWKKGDAQYRLSDSDKFMYKLAIFPLKQNPTYYTKVSIKPCMPHPWSIGLHLNMQKTYVWGMRD